MKRLDAGVHAALLALDPDSATDWASIADLLRIARDRCPGADTGRLVREIGRLHVRGAIALAVHDAGEILCDLASNSTLSGFDLALHDAVTRYRLSRFTLVRRADRGLRAESLVAGTCLRIRAAELGAVLAALHEPAEEADVVRTVWPRAASVLRACLRLMAAGGVIAPVDEDGLLPEDREPVLPMRDPHDLLIHSRSRRGLSPLPVGATFRHASVVPPLPALRPAWPGRQLPLPRPDLHRLARTDPPLVVAMERRASGREWADQPLTVEAVGELLYRVFRVRRLVPRDPADPHSYEVSMRPLPSAGAAHDLEVYLAAGRVTRVGRGLFHYDPMRHTVTEVTADPRTLSTILASAQHSASAMAEPPLVVVLASRFARLGWKYEGMAYAATLKNVGVAYSALYLATTAMGLAGCALGTGDAVAFATATRVRPHVESPVGEFIVGPVRT
ncbi:SagB family peptide dehydrogenase [Plantactinospora sp. GCM10030261]|uniref:SagB family peptide dehydrogenase n=1 Tax=Plantactinospora sp. GCM10030261 TaxID=3273420 RepID=UPI00361B0CE0